MKLIQGDCLEVLKSIPDNSVDSVITDPPAGISFMNKSWDSDKGGRDAWIAWMSSVMKECLRVLKPGGHALVWAIPRTSHWTATAVEDAGFEVRDVVTHLFGSGFPKSLDISKAIDKEAGAKREFGAPQLRPDGSFRINTEKHDGASFSNGSNDKLSSLPSTPEAIKWQGFGTALKPAAEFWILARKPLSEKTVAKNVLKHGTGGLNIDASRISGEPWKAHTATGLGAVKFFTEGETKEIEKVPHTQGRFPANLVLSGDAPELLDEQSGTLSRQGGPKVKDSPGKMYGGGTKDTSFFGDSGGASRFFYCAKVSPSERNAGLDGMEKKETRHIKAFPQGGVSQGKSADERGSGPRENNHPTVKPQKLMQYLIKLITPPGGTVLDPFMGSGSTGLAAKNTGFSFIGIEQEPEYMDIAKKRLA